MSDLCRKCGDPIPADRRADSAYCCATCKAGAKYERERLQRILERRTDSLASLRALGPGATAPEYLDRLQAELDGFEARLLELLDA